MWCALAGIAQLGLAAGVLMGLPPFATHALSAIGGAFILPAVALLHARHAPLRASGAVLATIAACAVVAVGIASIAIMAARIAWLVLIGMWWWTLGKMSRATGSLPGSFGGITMIGGALALTLAAFADPAGPFGVDGAVAVFAAGHALLGAWLLALAAVVLRR